MPLEDRGEGEEKSVSNSMMVPQKLKEETPRILLHPPSTSGIK